MKHVPYSDPRTTLEARKLNMSFWVFMALLASVNIQMLTPLAMSIVRRPPDNIVNNSNQLTLLIAGALCTGAGYFLGARSDKEGKQDALEKPLPPEPPAENNVS
jgi:hypothetical protein